MMRPVPQDIDVNAMARSLENVSRQHRYAEEIIARQLKLQPRRSVLPVRGITAGLQTHKLARIYQPDRKTRDAYALIIINVMEVKPVILLLEDARF